MGGGCKFGRMKAWSALGARTVGGAVGVIEKLRVWVVQGVLIVRGAVQSFGGECPWFWFWFWFWFCGLAWC